MSAGHMLVLVVGVLMAGSSMGAFANSQLMLLGWALLVAGLPLIIIGAAGLGRGIRPQTSSARTPVQPESPADAPTVAESTAPGSPVVSGIADDRAYPSRLEGLLDPDLSRWMWLVKWLLAIPHYIVLSVLWAAFLVVTVVAGFMVLFTGRYPASLFQFAVGVFRWNWRVAFYANGVLGTDRYPPFTLARTDYPATFDVQYPDKLSHWQVLVKSWLFALPHLLIIAALGGGAWAASSGQSGANGISALGLLVFIAGVILLFTGVYRLGLFNLIMGIHRWMYRAFAYAALMRDDYPPFRLDQGALDRRT
jgi:hypothetical protein